MSGAATAIGIGAAVGGIGSIASGAIGAGAAKDAASQQSAAADKAAQLQYQASQDALQFQKQQYADTQKTLAPWLQAGNGALSNLQQLLGIGSPSPTSPDGARSNAIITPGGTVGPVDASNSGAPGSLMQGYGKSFTAPTGLDMQNDPGYQARLKLGTDTLQRSAASRGNLLTGGTAKALDQFSQDYASNEYNNVYNRALTGYTTDYNQFQQNQANQYNRLASLAGLGQTTASTLANVGQNTANGVSNTLMSGANAQANGINNAAAANASGIVGAGNAWGGALSGATGNVNNLLLLRGILNGQNTSGGAFLG